MRARRAFRQLPVIFEQHLEIAHVPGRRVRLPRALDAAGDGVAALAAAMGADPAQAHLVDRGRFRLGSDQRRVTRTMRLAEGVPTGHQRHGLIVVHRHAAEGLAHVAARGHRIGVAVGAFGVDVDQTHLHGGQRVFQLALAGIAQIAQPAVFLAPIDVFLGLPDVGTTAAKAEGLEAHRLHRDVARQDEQVSPGNAVAVFLLDRPQQAARLVQVGVVRPAVGRRETLRPGAAAPATVSGAIGARAVPGHADEQTAVVTPVRRPPILAVGHQRGQVLFQGLQVQLLEFLGIVEGLAHRVDLGRMLAQDLQVQRIGPPLAIRAPLLGHVRVDRAMHDRAFANVISVHVSLRFLLMSCPSTGPGGYRRGQQRVPGQTLARHIPKPLPSYTGIVLTNQSDQFKLHFVIIIIISDYRLTPFTISFPMPCETGRKSGARPGNCALLPHTR